MSGSAPRVINLYWALPALTKRVFAVPRATSSDDPQPQPPVQPDLDDCCHSGCNPCVFDLYDAALERYRSALAEWQERQARHAAPTRQNRPRARR
ncbi:oxidoreductase-like domain-containing protein [Paraburkholderia ginsengisoli]|uniref:Oxidoreductase-like domain-containing protein n=1 Tax=Paraburkholderia ginsengisoli TaxID=311231 RepID=A0A7T4N8E9_9BURK|nr:oxidoreductase-like domain-containing protein [Paraburkholderia ginsengisoli]QQC67131.1 hypothetical protein I6I06_19375 [Paraburkholderia ginsengisoli]